MNRIITAAVLGVAMASAGAALAGPNGTASAPFFPLYQHRGEMSRHQQPHALLGTADEPESRRAIPPAVSGKQPLRGWLRRPSEGK